MAIKIAGTGSCLPGTVVTNDDLAAVMETSDEWICSRTGIRERRLAKEETTTGMALAASLQALADAGFSAKDLDLIIVGSITGDYVTPSTACELQAALGADRAVAFDINAACSGFMFALNTAYAYLQCGLYQTALVVGAETLSKIMDWTDRSTCVLFGDGAGAAIVQRSSQGLYVFEQGSDGKRGQAISCRNRPCSNFLVKRDFVPDFIHMDGQEVYKFAVGTVPASINRVLEKAQIEAKQIEYFILHQANLRILQAVAKRLKAEENKFPVSLDHCGNISAASVPILLDEMNRKGALKRGDLLVLSGFGAGLTWGTAVLEW